MMNDNNYRVDFRAIFDSVGDAIRSMGNSVTDMTQPGKVWSDQGLRAAMLTALKDGPKTGHGVIVAIQATNEWGITPSSSRVYPQFESLLDEGLVSVATVQDRKVYELTAEGIIAEASKPQPESDGVIPKWPGLRGDLMTASGRLAKVAFDVSQHGSPEQQALAAKAIDDARRALHKILAAK